MTQHTTTLHNLISTLTGRVGRCSERDLDQTSLLDTVKLKAVGAIMECVRKHFQSLPTEYACKVSKVSWSIDARDLSNVKVCTSVGLFKFAAEGHDVRCQKAQSYSYHGRY